MSAVIAWTKLLTQSSARVDYGNGNSSAALRSVLAAGEADAHLSVDRPSAAAKIRLKRAHCRPFRPVLRGPLLCAAPRNALRLPSSTKPGEATMRKAIVTA